MRKALSMLIAANIAFAPVGGAFASEEAGRIVEAYFEHHSTTPQNLQKLATSVFRSGRLEAESLKFSGDIVKIPATAKRVKGSDPPCLGNKSPQDQTAEALQDFGSALAKGSIAFWPLDPTFTMSGILFITGAAIAAVGTLLGAKTFQETANCSLACAAVPGTYQKDDLAKIVQVSYTYNRGGGAADRPIAPLDAGDWFVASDWVTSNLDLQLSRSQQSALFDSLLIKQETETYIPIPRDNQTVTCPTTLVCTQAKT